MSLKNIFKGINFYDQNLFLKQYYETNILLNNFGNVSIYEHPIGNVGWYGNNNYPPKNNGSNNGRGRKKVFKSATINTMIMTAIN